MLSIFYPFFVTNTSPQATIAKETSKRLNAKVYAFADRLAEVPSYITPIRISPNRKKRGFQYILSYLRDVDIVHTGPFTHNVAARATKLAQGASIVHTFHAIWMPKKMGQSRKWLAMNADETTAVSEYVKSNTKYQTGEIIPNGVDFNRFSPTRSKKRTNHLIYVGRLNMRKNAGFLVDLAGATEQVIDVYGDGELRDKLENSGHDNLRIHGYIDRERLPAKYAEAKTMLCPTEKEGFGMTALESLASGTPVVALRSGAHPEFIGYENGTLVDTHDPSDWVDAIETAKEIDETTVRHSIKQHNWDRVAEQYSAVYQRVV